MRPAHPRSRRWTSAGVLVKQHTSQCCRFACCQPDIDWNIHTYVSEYKDGDQVPQIAFIKEHATCPGRTCSFCYPAARQTRYTVHQGTSEAGPIMFTHEKPLTCSHCPWYPPHPDCRCPWCCGCLPYLETKDPSGRVLGKTEYICDMCLFVPKFDISDGSGKVVYRLRPDTCCADCCIMPRCGGAGGKCLKVPFLLRKPEAPFDPIEDAAIVDLWAGFKKECCTQKNIYAVKFPNDANEDMKKTLTGATLLLDLVVNEQQQG